MTQSGFANAGLTAVLLPSGFHVRGVIPGLDLLATRGLLDGRVLASVIKLADPKWLAQAEPIDQERDLRAYVDALVAGFPVDAQDPVSGEWEPVRLTVEGLVGLDQRDRVLLEDLVMRIRTVDEVSAIAESVIAGAPMPGKEEPGDLDRLADFRADAGGAEDSGNGKGVDGAAVHPAAEGR